MINPTLALRALLEKSSDTELLREMVGFTAAPNGTGGRKSHLRALCQRIEDRIKQRNGFRDRIWKTRAGTIELRVPKLRHGSYFRASSNPGA